MNASFLLPLALLLFAIQGVFAQVNLPLVFELKTDTAQVYKLDGNFSQILEDSEDTYTIEQVVSPTLSLWFHQNNTVKTGVNRKIHTYWFRFRIHNQLNRDAELYLDSPLHYLDVYTPGENGQWQKQQTGSLVPWSQRDGLKYALKLPYTLKKGQQALIYQRLQTNRVRITQIPSPSFTLKERFLENFYKDIAELGGIGDFLIDGIFIGLSLITALYHIFIFFMMRERVYLYFCLWVFLYCCYHYISYIPLSLFAEHAYFNWVLTYFLSPITAIFQVLFIRRFLQTRKYLPAWDNALLIAISWFAVGGLILYLSNDAPLLIRDKLGPVFSLGYTVTFLLIGLITLIRALKGDRSARFLLLAILPGAIQYGIGGSLNHVYFLFTRSSLFSMEIWGNLTLISMAWIIIVFSAALIRRYNEARKEVAQQALEKQRLALEKERLEKEKEIERSQLIEAQKIELEKQVAARTAELIQSLEHLKATQNQLIQSEKMASLGELTAGIAHEIQNPLNFVNNFSEVSQELCTELKQELTVGRPEEATAIVEDLSQNLDKIHYHGQRADSIVKNMLQHSRSSAGKKELTNINALAEEYLRLAYHGLRAKDKDFNASLITDFDKSIGKVEVVPQELGRVLLNLYNNAFYATQQKKAQLNGQYQPEVKVSTCRQNGQVEIRVRDNGTGIPENVKSKIFQPFFTTKPTGQGTGLGLSLSYDIITKGHGGELKVDAYEGEGAEFIIQLPAT